ncbi:MAG: winged helix DNA-binding protein [Hymenobacter sp.]|nr:winged helix DNA-binding protein [Hymenobacter sp.]
MDYSLIKQLVSLAEEFQKERAPASAEAELAGFSAWLQARTGAPMQRPGTVEREPRHPLETDESIIGKLITFVYRYLRTYCRLALLDTPLISYDDFVYLAITYGNGPLSKTETIARGIHEKPTGTEIIKRLLKAGLIQEQPHTTDRRSKVLTITDYGRGVFFQLFANMSQVASMTAGNLNAEERTQLVYLLSKLDAFHFSIFTAARPATLEEMRQKYFPQVQSWTPPAGAGGPGAGGPPPGVGGAPASRK